jgi:DNA-binding MarR family transcriptional regulator
MDRYRLSDEGMARFKRRKISVDMGMEEIKGYEVLDYLYEHGAATVAEIESYTGLSWSQAIERLSTFIHHGFVEKLTE